MKTETIALLALAGLVVLPSLVKASVKQSILNPEVPDYGPFDREYRGARYLVAEIPLPSWALTFGADPNDTTWKYDIMLPDGSTSGFADDEASADAAGRAEIDRLIGDGVLA